MKFLPNKFQLDVLRRHFGPFVFCFFTLMFLLLMQFLILYIDLLIGKGLPFLVIIELIITNLASMVVLAIPMAVLVASLMAYGKLTELNELTALRAAGVNPFRIISPVLVSAIILSVFLAWFSNDVLPDANQRARSLFIDIRLKKPGFDLKPGEFYDGIDDYTFLVQDITSETDSLHDITIYQESTRERNEAYIKAKTGQLKSEHDGQTLNLFLNDGSVTQFLTSRKDGKRISVVEKTNFSRYRISFDLSDLSFSRSNPESRSRNDRTMKIEAMLSVVDSLRREIKEEKKKVNEEHSFLTIDIEEDHSGRSRMQLQLAQSGQEVDDPPYQSDYVVLNMLKTQNMQRNLHSITLSDLRNYRTSYENLISDTQWRLNRIASYLVEVHKKFSIPFACFIFVLLGAPIGMYTQKGNLGYAALIGTVFLTFYWISIIQGEKLADRHFITPFTGMWFSDILLSIIGGYMVFRLCTPYKLSDLWRQSD